MTRVDAVGIWGVGAYLPPTVRTNDWWPTEVVEGWRQRAAELVPESAPARPATEGQRLVLEALAEQCKDPYGGSRERRILEEDLEASHMELAAANDALESAGVAPSEIDLLLVVSGIPDLLHNNSACRLQSALGVPSHCLATMVDSVSNSFHAQWELAAAMIRCGRATRALLVQSTLLQRTIPTDAAISPWFGDAATAVVLGPVEEGFGLLASVHRVDGSTYDSLAISVPGGRWYDDGRPVWHPRTPAARAVILDVADQARNLISDVLTQAGVSAQAIDFYASHQASSWFRRVTQTHAGLCNARHADTYRWSGHVTACNVPLSLATACREGTLREGDLVVTFGGGTGVTLASTLSRWGRG